MPLPRSVAEPLVPAFVQQVVHLFGPPTGAVPHPEQPPLPARSDVLTARSEPPRDGVAVRDGRYTAWRWEARSQRSQECFLTNSRFPHHLPRPQVSPARVTAEMIRSRASCQWESTTGLVE